MSSVVSLHPYQSLAVRHLLTHERAALFMGLGLGKTYSTLTAFNGLQLLGNAQRMLVVAPLRVCNLTWPNECRKWPDFGHLRLVNTRSKAGWSAFLKEDYDVAVCNYEMLPKIATALAQLDDCPFDVVCFDELTRAKNPQSKRINAFRKVLPPHVRRWGLTGTPTPNSLMDLFAQLRLLDDGQRLGKSFDLFKRTWFYQADYMGYDWQPLPGTNDSLHKRIADITLTLLSSEFIHLPDTVLEDVEVALPDQAKAQYAKLERELLLAIGDDPENLVIAPNAAVLVNKLLQVTSGSVYNEKKEVCVIHDAKLEALKKRLSTVQGSVLVAYNYRHELERLRTLPGAEAFEDAKSASAQSVLETRWNEKRIPILLVHPASVSHGLNLQHGGSTVIWFSPTWSREMYDQLNGRVIRQGQKEVTRVIRILCPGTIDDAVVETLREKDEGQRALLHALRNFRLLHS